MIHPARTMPFEQLMAGLMAAKERGHVSEKQDGDLSLFVYSQSCTYEKGWDEYTLLARGLIIDRAAQKVVATPFPKFFNHGEMQDRIPDLPFETFEKVDGSLIIIYFYNGEWRTATKGSFNSAQAQWANKFLQQRDLSELIPGWTYLAEAVYPENRIVVSYDIEGLILLGIYDPTGQEIPPHFAKARHVFSRVAAAHEYKHISYLLEHAKTLSSQEEGFVLRFSDGTRLKIKGDEYCRIHRLISNVTPLAIWDMMRAGSDLETIRKELPEEFLADFDAIATVLMKKVEVRVLDTIALCLQLTNETDKEVGLKLNTFPEHVRSLIFPCRRFGVTVFSKNPKTRETLFRAIRPTGNNLEGYTPSYAINRVMDESA